MSLIVASCKRACFFLAWWRRQISYRLLPSVLRWRKTLLLRPSRFLLCLYSLTCGSSPHSKVERLLSHHWTVAWALTSQSFSDLLKPKFSITRLEVWKLSAFLYYLILSKEVRRCIKSHILLINIKGFMPYVMNLLFLLGPCFSSLRLSPLLPLISPFRGFIKCIIIVFEVILESTDHVYLLCI